MGKTTKVVNRGKRGKNQPHRRQRTPAGENTFDKTKALGKDLGTVPSPPIEWWRREKAGVRELCKFMPEFRPKDKLPKAREIVGQILVAERYEADEISAFALDVAYEKGRKDGVREAGTSPVPWPPWQIMRVFQIADAAEYGLLGIA